ncbi:unnamed protein product [Phytophthora lilii]|uniref:Unnamed protein product n=1 Tax=Phytophthora lilii TaxID=2077276 RepID=A0A9W6TA58_9STRA|nr:unnamed protein product [Phytophthora lilii]
MAWGKNRHGGSAASGARSASSGGRGGRRRPPGEPSDEDVARGIQQSPVRVRVALQLGAVQTDAESLRDLLSRFERVFEARRGAAVTATRDVRVELLECGLGTWQHLVELQRVLAALKRPTELGQELMMMSRTTLRHDAKYDEWTLALTFARPSEDALWRFASSLMLRLRSCGVLSRVLMHPHRLVLPLESAFVEWGNSEIEGFKWEGRHAWSQVVVDVVGDQREEAQRVFLPPILEVDSASQHALSLRYPELEPLVDNMLKGNADARKPVVVILRGIPGSGKSTLGREIKQICRHRGVAFTACSADFFFETPRGYVFDVKKLGPAHSKCKGDFTRAIHGDVPHKQRRSHQHIVLVDNTSTQRWEYEPYEEIAQSNGSRVYIVEMKCPNAITAFRMGKRNSHGVPPDKVVSMFLRWEEDTRAHCFTPQFENAALTSNPLSDGEVGGITYLGLFLNESSKEKLLTEIPLLHPNKVADHVTLFYRPNKQYVRDAEVGASVIVRGVEVIHDRHGQTLRVEIDERLPLQVRNKVPHITMSTQDGVSAAYSNDLLENAAATRTIVDPPIELIARVGVALFVQNQRVITTTSPFAVDRYHYHSDKGREKKVDSSRGTIGKRGQVYSKLFILYVNVKDLVGDNTIKLLWQAQVLHHMGSQSNTRRLLCVHSSSTFSSSSLLSKLQGYFLISASQCFDDMVMIPQHPSFQVFEAVITKYLAGHVSPIMFTMLTTVEEALQWPLHEMMALQHATLNVVRLEDQQKAVSALALPCKTVTSMLDLLGITIQEETRSAIASGVNSVIGAWADIRGAHEVQRIDSTLQGLSSRVVELCLKLPSDTTLSEVGALETRLLDALHNSECVWRAERSGIPGRLYFSLRTLSSYSPDFCVTIQQKGASSVEPSVDAQLKFCEHQQRVSREICDIEAYSMLVSLLRAILMGRCSSLLPSECRFSSLINLLSERLVLRYLESTNSSGGADARPTADDVTSGRILFVLYRVLTYLSKLGPVEWPSTFGDSIQALQGNEKAQATWTQAMESVIQSCMSAMASYRCVESGMKGTPSLSPEDHLHALVALMTVDINNAADVSSIRAYIEVRSRSTWSRAHLLACCDKLRHAAAMVLAQDDDGSRNSDSSQFFSCAPSLVAGRVDVTASSLELLRSVIEKLGTLEANERDSDSEGALSGDLAIRRAETDEELLA